MPFFTLSLNYDYEVSYSRNEELADTLIDYQLRILDAIGIKYGAVNSEIMVDEDGPVLIEANSRLCGGNQRGDFMQECFGVRESRLSVQSYLYPDLFQNVPETVLFENKRIFVQKVLTLYKSTYVQKIFLDDCLKDISSFRYAYLRKEKGFFSETINLTTGFAIVNLACEDEEDVDRCLDYLHDLENNHPEKLFKSIDIPIVCKIAGKFTA